MLRRNGVRHIATGVAWRAAVSVVCRGPVFDGIGLGRRLFVDDVASVRPFVRRLTDSLVASVYIGPLFAAPFAAARRDRHRTAKEGRSTKQIPNSADFASSPIS